MIADTLTLTGKLTVRPSPAAYDSARPAINADILEMLACYPSLDTAYVLTSDAPQVVSLGGLASAAFVLLKGDGSFTAIYTTGAHAMQQVDGVFHLILSPTSPVAALSLVRPMGVQTTVRVVLGQAA